MSISTAIRSSSPRTVLNMNNFDKYENNNNNLEDQVSVASNEPMTTTCCRRRKRVSFRLPEGHRDDKCRISDSAEKLQEEYERHRMNMFCFLKVLFVYLQKTDQILLENSKRVVQECYCRHKNQEPGFISLPCALERSLRQTVGECIWRRAKYYHLRVQTVQKVCHES